MENDKAQNYFDLVGAIIVIINKDGRISLINKKGCEILGYSKKEIIGRNWFDNFVSKQKKDEVRRAFKELMAGKTGPSDIENNILTCNGEKRTISWHNTVLTDGENINGILISGEDITQRKKDETQIKFLIDTLSHINDAVIVVDNNYHIVYWNKGAEKLFNQKSEEVIGKLLSKIHQPKWINYENGKEPCNSLETYGFWQGKNVHIKRNSESIWVNLTVNVLRYENNDPIGVLALICDITECKRVEEELKEAHDNLELKVQERTKELSKCNIRLENDIEEIKSIEATLRGSEEKFRALAENSPDIISRFDKELRYTYINHGSNTLELLPEDFIGKKLEEIAPTGEITKIWVENAKKVLKTSKIQEMEFEFPSIHGLKVYNSYIIPEYNAEGEIETLLAVSHDTTKRKQLEEELKETVEELKRSNKELQQFAYVASHDLREPLRTIASFTQLLAMRYKDKLDNDADEYIKLIVDGTKRMQQLINDLLTYSRIATKGREFKPIDLEKVLNDTFTNLNTLIYENNAEITHDSLPIVMGDSRQLIQLFQNLITNAIKFRKENEHPKIHISASLDKKKNEYVFQVVDNGIGIDPKFVEHIFTLFQRLHTRDEYPGTGIGLSISKKVVERHGGHIWAESELDKGSTFYFTIPINLANLSKT